MVYHLKNLSFTICLQLKKNIPSLLLPIQKHFEHLEISPFTIYLLFTFELHENFKRGGLENFLRLFM